MKKFLFFCAFLSLLVGATQVNAQFVTIPDANFRAFLQQQYPTCFNPQGNMDTTCAAIGAATSINCSNLNISDLTGIRYFRSLETLNCSNNMISTNFILPASLGILDCSFTMLNDLPILPSGLEYLNCSGLFLANLPNLPSGLRTLYCGIPTLQSLPTLPPNLVFLDCQNCNGITILPSLPNTLQHLDMQNSNLTALPASLPPNLEYLMLFNNPALSCLPPLPMSLWALEVSSTAITCMPNYTNVITAANATLPLCIPNTCFPALCDGSGTDCVFPGDTNHDGVCNNLDVLPISVLDGQTGVVRQNANTNWYGQPCANWGTWLPNTNFNAKFADANGGGLIDSMDIAPIYTNYNRTNNGTIPTNRGVLSTNAVFPISIVFTRDTFNVAVSDTITADIFVGNNTLSASNFYGFAASITYDSTLFKPLSIVYNNASFMGSDANVNVFGIDNHSAQKYDIAIARRVHTNISGQGRVARIKGIIGENIAGKGTQFATNISLSLGISNIVAINNVNQSLPTNGIGDQCVLSGVTVSTENQTGFADENIVISPNPVHTNRLLRLNTTQNTKIERVEICDIWGRTVLSQTNTQGDNPSILVPNLPAACYFLRIFTDKNILTKRIVVE